MLVESGRDCSGEGKKGGGGAPLGAETMLGRVRGEAREEEGTDKALKDFGSRAKEGDGAIGGAEVKGFIGFRDG